MSYASIKPLPALVELPRRERAFMGYAALVPGDDSDLYEEMLATAAATVAPQDALEWGWVRDVVDLMWESRRMRRVRAGLLAVARAPARARLGLDRPAGGGGEPPSDDDAGNVFPRIAPPGFEAMAAEAEAWRMTRGWLEAADRAIAFQDQRRETVVRELERRRDGLARRMLTMMKADAASSREVVAGALG